MKTFVGLVFTLITSGGLGLLVYFTFRSGNMVDSSRHDATKGATEAANKDGEVSTTGPVPPALEKRPSRGDER